MQKPQLLEYEDFRAYLGDFFEFTKEGNPQFSYRKFSAQIGFASSATMKLIVSGKRNVAEESIQKIIKGLKFNRIEAEFFEALVYFTQAGEPSAKKRFFDRMLRIRKTSGMKVLDPNYHDYFLNWYCVPIRELVNLKDFSENPEWIAHKLRPSITVAEAKKAWSLLVDMKMVTKDGEGRWRQSDLLLSSGLYNNSDLLTRFHEEMLKLATAALWKIHGKEREAGCVTLSIKKDKVDAAIKRLIQFRRDFLATYDCAEGDGDLLFHLNMHFFPVSIDGDSTR